VKGAGGKSGVGAVPTATVEFGGVSIFGGANVRTFADSPRELFLGLLRHAGVRELKLVDPGRNIFEDQYGRRLQLYRVKNKKGFLVWTFKFL